MRGAAMSLSAAASGFVVFLLSVSVVQGQDVWAVTYTPTEICALKGSAVDMSCTFIYPSSMNGQKTTVDEATWFVNMNRNEPVDVETDPQYSGRVSFNCSDNDCALRITDLRESDSAEYKFTFKLWQHNKRHIGSPGVTLTVTDVQVEVSRSGVSQSSDRPQLKCLSRCPRPERLHYIWYKNGQKIEGQTSHVYSVSSDPDPADSFSCAVEGYEAFSSPPVYGKNITGPPTTTTTTTTRVTRTLIMNVMRSSLVVFILIPLLLLLSLWMRKKKTLSSTTEAHEPVEMIELDSCPAYENVSDLTAAQTEDTAAGRRGVKSSQVNQRRDSPDGNKAGPH